MITASTILSVAIFSGVILILVLMLNLAESKTPAIPKTLEESILADK